MLPLSGFDVGNQCELRSKKVPGSFCSFVHDFVSFTQGIHRTNSLTCRGSDSEQDPNSREHGIFKRPPLGELSEMCEWMSDVGKVSGCLNSLSRPGPCHISDENLALSSNSALPWWTETR